MIQRNNNLSVLPFYENAGEQQHRLSYAYGEVYPLYTPLGTVPPFQIIRNHNGATVSRVVLERVSDGHQTDITAEIAYEGLVTNEYEDYGYDIVIYPSNVIGTLTETEGRHFLLVTMTDGTVYTSDYFTVVADMSGFLQVQWWDGQDLVMDGGRIAYSDGYRNTLWLATQLGKPDYDYEEEGETRDGYFFTEKIVSEKRYKCVILAPEYLCDVMRFIRMSDVVYVRDRYSHLYRCDTFLYTPKWETQGDLASVEIEFTCETVAKKIGYGFTRIGQMDDFNGDFNDDYDTINN